MEVEELSATITRLVNDAHEDGLQYGLEQGIQRTIGLMRDAIEEGTTDEYIRAYLLEFLRITEEFMEGVAREMKRLGQLERVARALEREGLPA